MNIYFKRLAKPRITSFAPSLIGHSLPERTKTNSAEVGVFIDKLVRNWAGASTNSISGVDLEAFGIEVKSQDADINSSWTIGSMTFADLISTNYVDSSIYQKLQALFLVRYNNKIRIITEANLYYLDNDDIQFIFEKAYETARNEAITYQLNFQLNVESGVFVYGDEKIKFDNSHQFKGTPGYLFEYNNSGTTFKFRVSYKEMRQLTRLATANNNALFNFL